MSEMRLMTDVAQLRRAFKSHEITKIVWICSEKNSADALTRLNGNEVLFTTLHTRHTQPFVEA